MERREEDNKGEEQKKHNIRDKRNKIEHTGGGAITDADTEAIGGNG